MMTPYKEIKDYQTCLFEKFSSSQDEERFERYQHSIGVMKKAIELIDLYHLPVDKNKAMIAGILHDYAKLLTKSEFEDIVLRHALPLSVLDSSPKVWHALLGRWVVEDELDIHDEEILSAIEFHTTGKKQMTPLQEVIFLSDYIEDQRQGKMYEKVRNIAMKDYKKAIAIMLEDTITYVRSRNLPLHPYTLEAYEDYKKYKKEVHGKLEEVLETIDRNLVENIMVYDVRNFSSLCDYVIVTTALSETQMFAAIHYLSEDFILRGIEKGHGWSLVDLGDIVVHLFLKEDRELYGLDRLYINIPKVSIQK